MKKIIRIISNITLVQALVRVIIKFKWAYGRVWSHLRFKALVPNSGDSVCHFSTEIKFGKNIRIGDGVAIGPQSCLGAKSPITIGNNVTVSRGCSIETAALDLSKPPPYKHYSKPIVIKDNVWIASDVLVLAGVTINEGALIGAGAVITKDVPKGAIIVGAKNRNLKETA